VTNPDTATADRRREQARLRQQRRREKLRQQRGDLEPRYCICCSAQFQPKRQDSWLCSRRCIDRLADHRRRAQQHLEGALLTSVRLQNHPEEDHGQYGALTSIEALQAWWRSDACANRSDKVSRYWLWFPDLCGIEPQDALFHRMEFQRLMKLG